MIENEPFPTGDALLVVFALAALAPILMLFGGS